LSDIDTVTGAIVRAVVSACREGSTGTVLAAGTADADPARGNSVTMAENRFIFGIRTCEDNKKEVPEKFSGTSAPPLLLHSHLFGLYTYLTVAGDT
jgi:hypothetical protein